MVVNSDLFSAPIKERHFGIGSAYFMTDSIAKICFLDKILFRLAKGAVFLYTVSRQVEVKKKEKKE